MSLINKYLIEKIASHRNFRGRGSTIVIKFAAGLAKSCILALYQKVSKVDKFLTTKTRIFFYHKSQTWRLFHNFPFELQLLIFNVKTKVYYDDQSKIIWNYLTTN